MNGFAIKLNKAEQIKVQSALESVETLKFKVKRQMATRRIVDITPKPAAEPKPEEVMDSSEKKAQPSWNAKNSRITHNSC